MFLHRLKKIFWMVYWISVFFSLFMVLGPIMRGEKSWWFYKEYTVANQKWSFWDGALISYFYFVFYSLVVIIIWMAWERYKARNFYPSTDRFYSKIPREQISLYQQYFTKIVDSINIDTQTSWSQQKEYDKEQLRKNEQLMESIILNDAVRDGLNSTILQVMVNQYIFADVYERELDKEDWVKRVIQRKDVDYFPSGFQMRALLEKSA